MNKILIYGGAFDPPHYGHIHSILEVINSRLRFDEIWAMPYAHDALGIKQLSDNNHRYKMLEILLESVKIVFKGYPIKISKIDFDAGGFKNTYTMIKELQESYKETKFSLLIGSDQAEHIDMWSSYKKLINVVSFVIIPRGRVQYNKLYWAVEKNSQHVMLPPCNSVWNGASSTYLRQQITIGTNTEDLYNFTSPLVLSYIKNNKLYKKEEY